MQVQRAVAMLALVATAATSAAHADTIFTVFANYDAFGPTDNTTFEIDNATNTTLMNVDISSGGENKILANIGAHSSVTYSFDDQQGGNFQQDPGDAGLPDTTTYKVSATIGGQEVVSNLFSAVNNQTGSYVDFLGACFRNLGGCSGDPSANYPLNGTVAQASTVPLPATLPLLISGLLGLGRRFLPRQPGRV